MEGDVCLAIHTHPSPHQKMMSSCLVSLRFVDFMAFTLIKAQTSLITGFYFQSDVCSVMLQKE